MTPTTTPHSTGARSDRPGSGRLSAAASRLTSWLLGDAGRGRHGGAAGGDAVGEVCGVVVDEAEQGRAAGVLPGQAQEVQAGHLGHAPPVHNVAFTDHTGNVD